MRIIRKIVEGKISASARGSSIDRGGACCDHCGEPPSLGRDEMRCSCGNLLAKWVPEGVELKCRRCKRTVVLPVEGMA